MSAHGDSNFLPPRRRRLNDAQAAALCVGLALFILATVVPPWIEESFSPLYQHGGVERVDFAGYHPLFRPPTLDKYDHKHYFVDLRVLSLEWAATAAATALFVLLGSFLAGRPPRRSDSGLAHLLAAPPGWILWALTAAGFFVGAAVLGREADSHLAAALPRLAGVACACVALSAFLGLSGEGDPAAAPVPASPPDGQAPSAPLIHPTAGAPARSFPRSYYVPGDQAPAAAPDAAPPPTAGRNTVSELLRELNALGVELTLVEGKLHVHAPRGVLTPHLRDEITKHTPGLIRLLARKN